MPNSFKLPATPTDQIIYDAFIPVVGSGYLFQDNKFRYAEKITHVDGKPIIIDGDNDFYVTIYLVNDKGEFVPAIDKFQKLLPSCLFKDCVEGDVISFNIDGKTLTLRLNQQIFPKICRPTPPQDQFQDALRMVEKNIFNRQFMFHIDNALDPNQGDAEGRRMSYVDPALKVRKPFFDRARMVIHDNAVIAHGNGPERKLTKEDLSTIPSRDSGRFQFVRQDSPTQYTIGVPGANRIQDISYFRQDGLLYIWVPRQKSPNSIYDSRPEYEVLSIPCPEWAKNGVRFEESGKRDGLIHVLPRIVPAPEPSNKPFINN